MSKKGYPEVLKYIQEKGPVYYNDILEFALDRKLVKSRASIPAMVNGFHKLGVVDREEIITTRPMRTKYTITRKGEAVLGLLTQLDSEIT